MISKKTFWFRSLKIKEINKYDNPADAEEWEHHLGFEDDVEVIKAEGLDTTIGYCYHSCCGRENVLCSCQPAVQDDTFFVMPPTEGSKNDGFYCKDCIKIWRNMQLQN